MAWEMHPLSFTQSQDIGTLYFDVTQLQQTNNQLYSLNFPELTYQLVDIYNIKQQQSSARLTYGNSYRIITITTIQFIKKPSHLRLSFSVFEVFEKKKYE